MKKSIVLTAGLLAGLALGSAWAQPGGMGGMGLGPAAPLAGACQRAADPPACEARRKAHAEARRKAVEACSDVAGPDRRRCIRDLRMAAQDCTTTTQPERCQQLKDAYEKCREHKGPAMHDCMHDQAPPDCARAADPKRCAAMEKARAACKDKPLGPERRQCLSAQPGATK